MSHSDFDVVTGPSMPSRRILPPMPSVKPEAAPARAVAAQPAAANAASGAVAQSHRDNAALPQAA